jgi:uncharacterized protein YegJ (DUF2314 family)
LGCLLYFNAMKKYLILIGTAFLFIAACGNKQKNTDQEKEIVTLKTDDQEFLALKDTAQKHINVFIDSLKQHAHNPNYEFYVKSDFVDGKQHEHMWSTIKSYNNGTFAGTLTDSVYLLKNISKDAPVSIKTQDIEDWIISDAVHEKQTGGFSIEYLKSHQK